MPEYGEELKKNMFWEWKPYYLNYDRLKGWIKEMEKNKCEKAINMFHEELELSLQRVHLFYLQQEKTLEKRFKECHEKTINEEEGLDDEEEVPESAEHANRMKALDEDIRKLQCFAEQNCEGFRKIAKKYDKNMRAMAENSDLDFSLPDQSLQDRVISAVNKFPFSEAERRLTRMKEVLEADTQGFDRQTSFIRHHSFGRLVSPTVELDVPLMRPKATSWRNNASIARKVARYTEGTKAVMVITLAVFLLYKWNPTPMLTRRSYIVIWTTSLVLCFLVRQFAPDIILMCATLFLTVCGILKQQDAWAAFSNDVVLSVAGLGVVAHAVEKTGIIDVVFSVLLGKPTSLPIAMLRLFVPAVLLNVCISNTCVMSCLMTVVDKWSTEIGHPKAFFLMPLSYLLLISGTFAIFSTSTNLIAQGLLLSHGLLGFNMFDLAIPAVCCTGVAMVYLILFVPVLLRRFQIKDGITNSRKSFQARQMLNRYDARIQITGRTFKGQTLNKSELLNKLSGGMRDIVSCERYGAYVHGLSEEHVLELDDILWIRTTVEGIVKLFQVPGVSMLALDLSDEWATVDQSSRDLVEAVLDKESPLVGHRLGSAKKYRPEYECPIIAYRAFNDNQGEDNASVDSPGAGADIGANPETRLRRGDHIILNAASTFYSTFKDNSDFVVLRRVSGDGDGDTFEREKAVTAGCILLGLVALVSTSTLKLLEAVMVSLAAMVFFNITTMDAIVKAVKLRTVLTIVGAFGLGKAIGQEGVANILAEMLIFLLSPFGSRGLLVAVFAATVALGVIFHGTAVVVLMFPICLEVAQSMDIPIHQLIAVLCLSVSCQMLSPISYQTNLMAYSTGGYQFADFTKVGFGLVICIAVVTIPMCEWQFPK